MRGVYIASQLADDNSIHTMITYNRGGEWQPITRPAGTACADEKKSCYLQIHGQYSIKRGIRANPPLSVSNAVGLILVHGHVSEALQTTDPDVFVSSDGGYSWRLSLKGPHYYQIADHGGLLVAVPADTSTPSVIKFSTDEGRCWISYNYTTKHEPILFTGLLVEPGNRAMTVAIWGYTNERIWHTHFINFTAVVDRQCNSDDYEEFVSHVHNKDSGCLLGKKEKFRRLKPDSWCYNGMAYKVDSDTSPCLCTADDYDCDYSYIRQNDVCIKDSSVDAKEIDICKRGHEERFVPLGYHKIPGDVCQSGFTPRGDEIIDLQTKCTDDTVGEEVEHGAGINYVKQQEAQKKSEKKTISITVFIVLLVIAAIAVGLIVLTVVAKKYRARQLTYRYISISADGSRNGLLQSSGTSLYDDSSDEENMITSVAGQSHGSNGTMSKSSKWNSTNPMSEDEALLR
jgi:sortilin